MSRFTLRIAIAAVLVAVLAAPASAALETGYVRVVQGPVPIQGWYRVPDPEILLVAESGTILEALLEEDGWYWVIVPPDAHGTRRAGWIRAAFVEPLVRETSTIGDAGPASVATAAAAPVTEDTVTITASHPESGDASVSRTTAHRFDDVHFERDRYALRQEEMDVLRAAVAALKADPSLELKIEGHTCSLGRPAYNLGLGMRRADAVKSYLVSQGISPERLHAVSLGEEHARYDNSSEETRRLNRRVALVPGAQP